MFNNVLHWPKGWKQIRRLGELEGSPQKYRVLLQTSEWMPEVSGSPGIPVWSKDTCHGFRSLGLTAVTSTEQLSSSLGFLSISVSPKSV